MNGISWILSIWLTLYDFIVYTWGRLKSIETKHMAEEAQILSAGLLACYFYTTLGLLR